MLQRSLTDQGQSAQLSSQLGPQKARKDPSALIISWTILAFHMEASDLLRGLCSLALADGEDKVSFYSLSEHTSGRHVYAMTLPLENTSAGLAMKFRWTVCTSKLGKRFADRHRSTSDEQALLLLICKQSQLRSTCVQGC